MPVLFRRGAEQGAGRHGHRSLLPVNEDARAGLQHSYVQRLGSTHQKGILKPGGNCIPALKPAIFS